MRSLGWLIPTVERLYLSIDYVAFFKLNLYQAIKIEE